jgi:hypothetical protein
MTSRLMSFPANPLSRVSLLSSKCCTRWEGLLECAKMPQRENIAGKKFGRLTALNYAGGLKWNCVCECGALTTVWTNALKHGRTTSCGCYNKQRLRETHTHHGHTRQGFTSSIYNAWKNMMRRCGTPSNAEFHNYGQRGIFVCDKWKQFSGFLEDMGEKPIGLTLGRIDNNGPYSKENCRWETVEQQSNNKRSNHPITLNGETKTISEWARMYRINRAAVGSRIRIGWDPLKALTTPVKSKNEHPGRTF